METIETLLANSHNHGYSNDHGVIGCDLNKVNRTISLIENSRDENQPIPGDIIICKGPKDRMYPRGHLEHPITEGYGDICTQPMIPFVRVDDFDCLHFSTSGGYWLSCTELEMFGHKGKQTKVFCEWGHSGMTANGAIYFNAIVNVWELFLETIY